DTTDKCYKFLGKSTLNRSITQCEQLNSVVTMIRSAEENQALMDIWTNTTAARVKIYLGARRTGSGKLDFKWLDGTNITYNSYALAQMTNSGGIENCLELFIGRGRSDSGVWNDVRCDGTVEIGVCEKPKR
ncbi:unnamed protein product, partial [Mesorhabditis spiculigera]